MPRILATQETEIRWISFFFYQSGQKKKKKREILSQKYSTHKRAVGVAQVVEYLTSKPEALNSHSSMTPQKSVFKERKKT
jgi:hypothetical protein